MIPVFTTSEVLILQHILGQQRTVAHVPEYFEQLGCPD